MMNDWYQRMVDEYAKQVEAALNANGFDVWLDDSAIRVGVLLGKELLKAIESSRALVLIWSEAAKNSAWVNDRDSRCLPP